VCYASRSTLIELPDPGWARELDLEHLAQIRHDPAAFAPSGVLHLIFEEVLAYAAAEEAMSNGSGRAVKKPVIGPRTSGSSTSRGNVAT